MLCICPLHPSFVMSPPRCLCRLEAESGLATSDYCMYLWLMLCKMWATNGLLDCCMNGSQYSLRRWLLASKTTLLLWKMSKMQDYMYKEVCSFIALALEYLKCKYKLFLPLKIVILYILMLIRWPTYFIMHCNNLCCFSLEIHYWHSRTQQAQNNKTKWSWTRKSSGGW